MNESNTRGRTTCFEGTLDKLTDVVMEEVSRIGQNVKLMVVDEPLPVEALSVLAEPA